MKTIAAFLNSDGGMLIIGIDKNKNILGIEDDLNSFSSEDKKDQFLLYFDNIMEKYLGNRFYRYLDSRFVEIDNKTIFVVLVKSKSSEPTFLHSEKGDLFYIRRSASTVELKIKDATKYIGKSTEIDPLSPA
jgi:predicted HTH transcriptional regulator